ncbi:hypothetical protein CPB83DRAFT_852117 [Crepidotus variabilis]|uniref:Uncharacterized protein n=1 Tax=Crepidotus variabilis TaxID=179855 RepID=A0A9P6EIY1_9AGAR|nr:hypothetical protein CPB83DRAFT_852117 [Crepidotus variabilis]
MDLYIRLPCGSVIISGVCATPPFLESLFHRQHAWCIVVRKIVREVRIAIQNKIWVRRIEAVQQRVTLSLVLLMV